MIVLISQHTRVRSTVWVKTEEGKERMIVGEREEISKNPLPVDLWDHRCTSAIVTRPTAKTDTLVHPGGRRAQEEKAKRKKRHSAKHRRVQPKRPLLSLLISTYERKVRLLPPICSPHPSDADSGSSDTKIDHSQRIWDKKYLLLAFSTITLRRGRHVTMAVNRSDYNVSIEFLL